LDVVTVNGTSTSRKTTVPLCADSVIVSCRVIYHMTEMFV